MSEPAKCTPLKGGYADTVCEALKMAVQHRPNNKSKGLFTQSIVNTSTDKWERMGSCITLHSGDFVGDGILLNLCPFCGGQLHDKGDE